METKTDKKKPIADTKKIPNNERSSCWIFKNEINEDSFEDLRVVSWVPPECLNSATLHPDVNHFIVHGRWPSFLQFLPLV